MSKPGGIKHHEHDITGLLAQAGDGDQRAETQLLEIIYDNLRDIAHRAGRNRHSNETLSTTGLVNEAYLRLFKQSNMNWANRRQFFAYAARTMRHLLVDQARRRSALRRGGDLKRDELAYAALFDKVDATELVAADQALSALNDVNARLVEVIELHVFAGLPFSEIATHLGVSERTVFRDWQLARIALKEQMA